jgi:hypothetical protein
MYIKKKISQFPVRDIIGLWRKLKNSATFVWHIRKLKMKSKKVESKKIEMVKRQLDDLITHIL